MKHMDVPGPAGLRSALSTAVLLVIFAALTGCGPVMSEELLEKVNWDLTFEEIRKDPGRYEGETVALGGSVISTNNLKETTIVRVLQQPLDRGLEPTGPEGSKGRFMVEFDGFVDPAIIHMRTRITVVGRVGVSRTEEIGNMPYEYPVIEPIEYHVWREPGNRVGVGLGLGVIIGR